MGTGADEHRAAAGLQLAGREVRRGRGAARGSGGRGSGVQADGAELEADSVELGPGTGVGGARADLPAPE